MEIFNLEEKIWAKATSTYLENYIRDTLGSFGVCNIALTGGRSAEILYQYFSSYKDLLMKEGINYFFSDERCVEPYDNDSNFKMASQVLFKNCEIEKIKLHRIKAEQSDLDNVCRDYASILPKKMDLIILGLGDDGHIASIFPNSKEIWERKSVIYLRDSRSNRMRISFGSQYLLSSRKIIVLAYGDRKSMIYSQALNDFNNIYRMPCRLVLHGDWFMTKINLK